MATVRLVEYEDASPEAREVYDDIMARKNIDWVPNIWKAMGSHPALLKDVWFSLQETMKPGRLDPLTKEMIAIAVSVTNGCEYCIHSHTAAARKLGLDDEMLGEVMAVTGAFNRTNALANGYHVDVDPPILEAALGKPKVEDAAD